MVQFIKQPTLKTGIGLDGSNNSVENCLPPRSSLRSQQVGIQHRRLRLIPNLHKSSCDKINRNSKISRSIKAEDLWCTYMFIKGLFGDNVGSLSNSHSFWASWTVDIVVLLPRLNGFNASWEKPSESPDDLTARIGDLRADISGKRVWK